MPSPHDPDASRSVLPQLEALAGGPPGALLDALCNHLRETRQHHKLFDARMLARKAELGLPLNRPTTLSDVPDAQRKLVEETYIAAAREVGGLFLAEGDIPSAWMYFQTIREPAPVTAAFEALPAGPPAGDQLDALIQIGLFQGAHPAKALRLMLRAHGTCSTITALDQATPQLTVEQRRACSQVLVASLYNDLRDAVERDVLRRLPAQPPGASLRELISGRDWLVDGGGYHIDVSHLHSVVRFARSLDGNTPELDLALQMAEYGGRLAAPLQYEGEPPFEDYYPAHAAFFGVLLDRKRDAGLQHFRDKLRDGAAADRPLLAYVLVDLLMRIDRLDEAVNVAAEHLTGLGDDVQFSFIELCRRAGRLDALKASAVRSGDAISYTTALLYARPPEPRA